MYYQSHIGRLIIHLKSQQIIMLVGVLRVSEVTHCNYVFIFAYSLSFTCIIKQAFFIAVMVILVARTFT